MTSTTTSSTSSAKEARQSRMMKIKSLRNRLPGAKLPLVSLPAVETTSYKQQTHRNVPAKGVPHDPKVARMLKNRESALKSRQRKEDEFRFLQHKVVDMEQEIHWLRSRLMQYEPMDSSFSSSSSSSSIVSSSQSPSLSSPPVLLFPNACLQFAEPAVFALIHF